MVQAANKTKMIGLLGGTFDPVHNGHLAVANHVLTALGLDAIWFIPAALPPHKDGHADGHNISSFAHRLAMLQIATAHNKSFIVSDIEAKRSKPSYSIDTINILLTHIGEQAELFFIIGVDAFLEIDTWKRFKELPSLVNFVIITRPGYAPDKVGEVIRRNFTGYAYDPTHETWRTKHSRKAFILQHMEPIPTSSTMIREKMRNNQEIAGLVPQAVEDYIRENKLFII